jgi:hypothetical protein
MVHVRRTAANLLIAIQAPTFAIALTADILSALGVDEAPHEAVVTSNDRRHLAKGLGSRPTADDIREGLRKILFVGTRRALSTEREFICRHRARLMRIALHILPGPPLAPAGYSRIPTSFWINDAEVGRLLRKSTIRPYRGASPNQSPEQTREG